MPQRKRIPREEVKYMVEEEAKTYADIGKHFGVSRQRIGQIVIEIYKPKKQQV